MIQEIAPHKFKNEYMPVPPKKEDSLLIYNGRKVLVRYEEGRIKYPSFAEMESCNEVETLYQNFTYLFAI